MRTMCAIIGIRYKVSPILKRIDAEHSMAARWYCVQWSHPQRGWLDLPSLASKKEKEANASALNFAEEHPGVVTRTIRKPHGWEPIETDASS